MSHISITASRLSAEMASEDATSLDLSGRFLRRKSRLPMRLHRYTRLEALWLSGNKLSDIPREFAARWQHLTFLELSDNRFTEFPREVLSLGAHLTCLALDNSLLKSLPAAISRLVALQTLGLDTNLLTQLPDEIGQLKSLKHLRLRWNELVDLPASLADLSNLEDLLLSNNKLTCVPACVCRLRRLRRLNLCNGGFSLFERSHNNIVALPDEIAQCTELRSLTISHNPHFSVLPRGFLTLSTLGNLREIELSGTSILMSFNSEKCHRGTVPLPLRLYHHSVAMHSKMAVKTVILGSSTPLCLKFLHVFSADCAPGSEDGETRVEMTGCNVFCNPINGDRCDACKSGNSCVIGVTSLHVPSSMLPLLKRLTITSNSVCTVVVDVASFDGEVDEQQFEEHVGQYMDALKQCMVERVTFQILYLNSRSDDAVNVGDAASAIQPKLIGEVLERMAEWKKHLQGRRRISHERMAKAVQELEACQLQHRSQVADDGNADSASARQCCEAIGQSIEDIKRCIAAIDKERRCLPTLLNSGSVLQSPNHPLIGYSDTLRQLAYPTEDTLIFFYTACETEVVEGEHSKKGSTWPKVQFPSLIIDVKEALRQHGGWFSEADIMTIFLAKLPEQQRKDAAKVERYFCRVLEYLHESSEFLCVPALAPSYHSSPGQSKGKASSTWDDFCVVIMCKYILSSTFAQNFADVLLRRREHLKRNGPPNGLIPLEQFHDDLREVSSSEDLDSLQEALVDKDICLICSVPSPDEQQTTSTDPTTPTHALVPFILDSEPSFSSQEPLSEVYPLDSARSQDQLLPEGPLSEACPLGSTRPQDQRFHDIVLCLEFSNQHLPTNLVHRLAVLAHRDLGAEVSVLQHYRGGFCGQLSSAAHGSTCGHGVFFDARVSVSLSRLVLRSSTACLLYEAVWVPVLRIYAILERLLERSPDVKFLLHALCQECLDEGQHSSTAPVQPCLSRARALDQGAVEARNRDVNSDMPCSDAHHKMDPFLVFCPHPGD